MVNLFIYLFIYVFIYLFIYFLKTSTFNPYHNSPVLQSACPRAVDSGEAKMRTASWENVDKQMQRNTK